MRVKIPKEDWSSILRRYGAKDEEDLMMKLGYIPRGFGYERRFPCKIYARKEDLSDSIKIVELESHLELEFRRSELKEVLGLK